MSTTQVDLVETYINEVRERLADVPEEDRVDLLDDVAAHVREIAEEFGPEELHERLGSPEEFTKELRVSAGYGPVEATAATTATLGLLRRTIARVSAAVGTDQNRALWRKLEPGWFVVRGVLLGYLVLMMTGADAQIVPAVGDNNILGFAVLIGGAVASYKLGERRSAQQSTWMRRARIGGEVMLVLVVFTYLGDAGGTRVEYIDSNPSYYGDACLRDAGGQPIGNLFAFDPSGQLIPQFFLTDQAGRPINNLCPDQVLKHELPVETQYARDVNGAPVYGVFPRAQTEQRVDPETQRLIKQPSTPPAVVFPQLAPPATPTTLAPAQP